MALKSTNIVRSMHNNQVELFCVGINLDINYPCHLEMMTPTGSRPGEPPLESTEKRYTVVFEL